MPTRKLRLLPGVNLEQSPTFNQANWAASDGIRFYSGQAEKIGGWNRFSDTPVVGTCRKLFGWADLLGNTYVAAGTEQRLLLYSGGQQNDITPIRATTSGATFTTTLNSTSVKVTDTPSGQSPSVGDWALIATHVAIGGLVLFGLYQVATIIDANNYTITAASAATATAGPGGTVALYTTTMGSGVVKVTLTAHGLSNSSVYYAYLSTSVAGFTIFGLYTVSVIDANNFNITLGGSAGSSTTASENGGTAQIQYLLSSGLALSSAVQGYGAGNYGSGDYGQTPAGVTFGGTLRYWSLDHFGQNLVAAPRDLGIYYWAPSFWAGQSYLPPLIEAPAVVMPNSPTLNRLVLTMSQVQMVVSCGSSTGSTQFPTLIRWSDAGDFTAWTTTATNQAGSYTLPSGSTVTAALAIGLTLLIWTDVDLYTMTYVGLPFVFSFNRIATVGQALSVSSVITIGNTVLWPTLKQFFKFDGANAYPIECPVWDFFYNNLDGNLTDAVVGGINTFKNEAIWFFPFVGSNGGTMGYVKYNYVENVWDYGQVIQRTAWMDHFIGSSGPLAADMNGYIQTHEVAPDAAGAAITWYVKSGYFDLAEGEESVYVDQLIPDFVLSSSAATVALTLFLLDSPTQAATQLGPFNVNVGGSGPTAFVNVEARARQMAIQIGGSDLGSVVRLGALRYRYGPDGRP